MSISLDRYLDHFLGISGLSAIGLLSLYLLAVIRLAPIVAFVPFFGAKLSPAPTRIMIAMVFALFFMPVVLKSSSFDISFNTAFVGYALKELLVGLLIAFLAMIPFIIATAAGLVIDYMRGASIMQMQDPSLQSSTSPIGQLYNYLLIVIFFMVDGPFFFFDALSQAFDAEHGSSFLVQF